MPARDALGGAQGAATLHVGDLSVAECDHLEALVPSAVGGEPLRRADDLVVSDLPELRLHLKAVLAAFLDLELQDRTGLVGAAS
jgi:hypothetical protein